MRTDKLTAVLRGLSESGIQCVVVEGLAAALHGATCQTYELGLVYSLEPANLERLLTFLTGIDAVFRSQPGRRLRPNLSHLAGGGRLNLVTDHGPMDLLGTIGRGFTYADLLPHTDEMVVGEGCRVRVLNLETIISIKEDLASEKDLAMLPLLRRTLEEMRKR